MDFPKGCSSNVHVVENLAQTRFILYSWKDDQVGGQQQRHVSQEVVTSLREQNILCAHDEGEIWVFGATSEEQKDTMRPYHDVLKFNEEGKLEDNTSTQTGGGKLVRDVLLDAIEGAIAFRLAKDDSATHVAHWVWLFASRDDDDALDMDSVAMVLHTRFTSTGSLYLVPELVRSRWASADSVTVKSEVDVLIAPYGRLAKTTSEGNAMTTIVSGASWRSQVHKALCSEGIEISGNEQWTTVEYVDDATGEAFEWPARLCFVVNGIRKRTSVGSGSQSWRSWFNGASSSPSFRNPLAAAEEWLSGAAAREQAMQQTSFATGLDESMVPTAATLPQNANDAALVTSPMFNQRNLEQQAAMAGIYPTPPDGLTQSQQMPNINAVTTPSVVQIEQGPQTGDLLPISDDSQYKGNEFNLSAEPEPYQMGQEDLFGDVGEMEFGEHEVGDADFSFFDEPDEEPIAPPMEDAEMLEAPLLVMDKTGDSTIVTESEEHIGPPELDSSMPQSSLVDTALVVDTVRSPKPTHPQQSAGSLAGDAQSLLPQPVQLEKPLSPFGIRERLLPPPVPASIAQNSGNANGPSNQRRSSTFSPIAFRDGFYVESKYANAHIPNDEVLRGMTQQPNQPDIALPSTRKKSRLLRKDDDSDEDSESAEDSYDSESSECEEELPPKLPWDNRKRKRHVNHDSANSFAWLEIDPVDNEPKNAPSQETVARILENSRSPDQAFNISRLRKDGFHDQDDFVDGAPDFTTLDAVTSVMPFIEDMYDLRKDDLICIAQVISEISITAFGVTSQSPINGRPHSSVSTVAGCGVDALLKKTVAGILPASEVCDLGKVSLTREPLPRPGTNPGKAPQGQPRPPQRADSMMLGPDYFPLAAPYVRVQRGTDNWEMLPASLCFWEPLGLGPASGPKNVRAFCLFPSNDDLQHLVEQFVVDLGTAFESCKLGSHVLEKDELDSYEDGMAPVELSEDFSLAGALRAYATSSSDLGKALSSISQGESDRTIVVYMVNPFEESSAVQHLCACFWLLFKAYRDNLPKTRRNQCVGDVVLQIIPINALASFDGLVIPDAKQMAALAREVYDRCPPSESSQSADNLSTLPILVAPSVELASAAPKRIGFQLTAEPPGDLLHEGSVLHLAYAISRDRQWLAAAWVDSTGQHQSTISFCMRGKSFADVAEDVWNRTREILAARQVTWRVFIVTPESVDRVISQCWRALSSKPRPQPLCVTLLSMQTDPALQLYPPANTGDQTPAQEVGFLTPASTPQGNNFTSSPDVSGHTNTPLTPAPSETAASIIENDPEAHLSDITDETWGVLLSPKLAHLASNHGVANGMIFKRGDVDTTPIGPPASAGEHLPSVGVSLHWTIQVKPSGGVDEGSTRQAELTLRELLKLYRSLALLTRARGLDREEGGVVPLHVAMAMRGARGLDGMLAPVVA